MFRSLAVMLVFALAASSVTWLVFDQAVQAGQALLMAVTDGVPRGTLPDGSSQMTWAMFLRLIGCYVAGMLLIGGVILNASARVLQVKRRSLVRSTAAMTFASLALGFVVILAWGLSVQLDSALAPAAGALGATAAYVGGAALLSFLAVYTIMLYSFNTTTGKAWFLVGSYRIALTFILAFTALSGWLLLAGQPM